ncbi:MAG: flagellar hook-basal body complex protein [Alphaproteobacteria bacterium]|nr:flagellar hook-basal body complex protein [Alphaproteobacteria bacterium]
MSLFGSLYTSVSGLTAQSQATAIISNNIANVNTTGFKRSEATFAALVTVESAAARYSPGAVTVNRLQQIDQQGQITQTGSMTDVSIAGDGFFTVRAENSLDLVGDFKYTRNGQFNEDEEGILQNSAGMYLYGWPVDDAYSDPNVGPDQTTYNADVSALVPIDVSLAAGQSRQTTEGTLGINLDADEISKAVDYTAVLPADQLVPYPSQTDYTRTLRVYDSLGSAQDLTFEFIKVLGPQAAAILPVADLEPGDFLSDAPITATAGNEFSVEINGGGPVVVPAAGSVDNVTTVYDLIAEINAIGGGGLAEAYLNDDGQLVISAVDPTHTLDITDTGGLLADFGQATPVNLATTGVAPTDNQIVPPFTDSVFPQFSVDPYVTPTAGSYNARGWWQVNIIGPNGPIPINQGLLNFNADGSLNALADLDGNVDIELRDLDWGNGSELQDIDINIDGLSQFAGLYNVSVASQNGAELGLKTGVEIDREGYVSARFTNGTLSRLYKLPITTFPSPTNLQEISTTSYVESAESGTPLLQEAGVSQAGWLESASIEQSNVDIADEFTKLIVTQRAYSANTKVINTVDQMTEDLLRLR